MNIDKYKVAFRRLNIQLNEISKDYKKPKIFFLIHSALCYLIYGSSPNDYIHFEFYKLRHIERKKYITMKKTYWLEKKFNDPKNADIFNNKYKFNNNFNEFVKRKWIYMPECSQKDFFEFMEKNKEVIVKPIDLSSGKGIKMYKIPNIKEAEKLYKEIKNKNVLIEQVVEQCEEMKKLNESSVNTIRIYTVLEKNDDVSIVGAVVRVGSKNSVVDNYHSGGVAAAIDIETGIVFTPFIDINNKRYISHPTNHNCILGFKIPRWKELKEISKQAAKKFKNSRYIGWDICITKDGFEFIEGNYNANPDLLQNCEKKGKYYILKNKI